MFSGIVETIGKILALEMDNGCKHFTIQPNHPFDDLKIGDSVAINGVCLTITNLQLHSFMVTAVPETLRLTNLNFLQVNDDVNLERSLLANSRIGGHYVQGHIDTMGEILEIGHDHSQALVVKIKLPTTLIKYVVNKGYIALDGMSITVIKTGNDWFSVTLIPHTQDVTIIKRYAIGTLINIEVDMMGKYIEKMLGVHAHANTNTAR